MRNTRRASLDGPLPPTLLIAGRMLALLALWPALACREPLTSSVDVAVTIDGEEIHYLQFESYMRDQADRRGQPSGEVSFGDAVQSRIFDQFIDGQLLIRLAVERGVFEPVASGTEAVAERPYGEPGAAERQALELLLRDRASQTWSDEEIGEYYESRIDDFRQPEQVQLRQILVEERARAVAAQQALARGEEFVDVAARFSQGPKAHLGGDQGRLARENLPEEFREIIFSLEAGEVSDIVSAYYGFLIFQVVERFDAQTEPLAAVADEIRQALARSHIDELADELLREARERYNVAVFPDNFPFDYQGTYAK